MQTVKINPNDLYQAGTEPDVIPSHTVVEAIAATAGTAVQKANNLSDIADPAAAIANLPFAIPNLGSQTKNVPAWLSSHYNALVWLPGD